MKKIIGALLLIPVLAMAQNKDRVLKEVEVKARIKPAEATLQRVVIDTNIIQAFKSTNLGDLLSQNSPINIKSYGRGNEQTATFRGTAPSHTQVYWNGVRINSPMVGAVDFGQIPMFFIDKLTVDAGVSAMGVASGALGGAVSIESTPAWGTKFGGELVQNVGSFTTSDTYLNIKAGGSVFHSSTKLLNSYSKNDFPFLNRDKIDPQNPGYRPTERNKNGDYRRQGFMQEFYIAPTHSQLISAMIWGLDGNTNFAPLTTYEGVGQNNMTNSRDKSLRAALTYKSYSHFVDLTARLTGDLQTKQFMRNNYSAGGRYETVIDSRSLNRSTMASLTASLKYFTKHTIEINGTAGYDYVDSYDKAKKTGFEKSRAEFSVLGAIYSQWLPRLATSVATRGSFVGGDFYMTPFAGIEYRVSDPFSIKGRVGYNVHSPSISDLYYVPGGNPGLSSEKSFTTEMGAVYAVKKLRAEINLFSSWITDWILWLPSHHQYWTPRNEKSVLSQGVELTVSNTWGWNDWGFYAGGNFTLNRTVNNVKATEDDVTLGKQLPFVPLISGGIFAKGSWRKVWLSCQIHGESERYATTSNDPGTLNTIAPYSFTDLGAGYSWKFLSLEVKCNNIFNEQYYTVLRRPLPRRSFEAMLRVRF